MPSMIRKDQFIEMPFPLKGIDTSQSYARQPELTTVQGENARGYDAGTQRNRGGTRSGISKFISSQVNGTSLIQHLNVIVTANASAVG